MEANTKYPRYRKWVNVSHALDHVLSDAFTVIQGLGKIDAQLISEDDRFSKLSASARASIDESFSLTDRYTLSYLWVLGAYEVIRAAWERASKKDSKLLPKLYVKKLYILKKQFTRLRIPLAKFQAAGSFPKDFPVAKPAMHRDLGISWKVASTTFVSRRKLSDRMLKLLDQLEERRKKGLANRAR